MDDEKLMGMDMSSVVQIFQLGVYESGLADQGKSSDSDEIISCTQHWTQPQSGNCHSCDWKIPRQNLILLPTLHSRPLDVVLHSGETCFDGEWLV
jgi:hypothetical protein